MHADEWSCHLQLCPSSPCQGLFQPPGASQPARDLPMSPRASQSVRALLSWSGVHACLDLSAPASAFSCFIISACLSLSGTPDCYCCIKRQPGTPPLGCQCIGARLGAPSHTGTSRPIAPYLLIPLIGAVVNRSGGAAPVAVALLCRPTRRARQIVHVPNQKQCHYTCDQHMSV